MRRFLLAAFCFWIASPLIGQDTDDTVEAGQLVSPRSASSSGNGGDSSLANVFSSNEDSFVGMVTSLLGLLIIMVGCGIVAWYMFRKGVFKKPFKQMEGKLKITENRMLGNRQFLMVVEYEDNKILLGVGPGKIDYLTSLEGYRKDFPGLEAEMGKMEEKA